MLAKHVITRKYGEYLYVINTNNQKSYVFDGAAVEIIEMLAKSPAVKKTDIAARLAEIYDAPLDVIDNDVQNVLRMLSEEGILSETGSAQKAANVPEAIVDAYCMEHHVLTNVMLEMTYRCNERCKHCYTCDAVKEQRAELTTQEYKRLLDELGDMNVREIVLTGGEIGLREDFSELYLYMVSKRFWITLMTNGTAFTEEQMDMLLTYPPKVVYISLYGASAQVHDGITQVEGSFERSMQTLMRLKCAGIMVCIKTVAMELNKHDYPNLIRLARRLHVGIGTGMFVTAGNNGSAEPTLYRLTEYEDYRAVVECKQKYPGAYTPWRKRDIEGPICEMGACAFSIDPYGAYRVCPSIPVACGNVRSMSVREFWNNSDFLKRLREMRFLDLDEECVQCEYRDDCVYCVGANYVETGGLIAIQRGACHAARAFHEYFRQFEGR